jgi:hypothetical protein
MKTYKGHVTTLAENQVFVFGSNLDGFHGAGSAGFATFGIPGNHWRRFDYHKLANGTPGKWNIKGVGRGLQKGTHGMSYALPTVTKAGAKRSRTLTEIRADIELLYETARSHPDLEFLIAQENKMGLNGYTPEEMAWVFEDSNMPENVVFEESFGILLELL